MIALLALLLLLVSGMNMINYSSVTDEADRVLQVLSHNKGNFPDNKVYKDNKHKKPFSPEMPYESRYFTVLFDENGNASQTNTSRIKSVNSEQAIELGLKAFNNKNTSGFSGIYRYTKSEEPNGIRIIFLDCRKQLESFYSFLSSSIFISMIGYLAVAVVVFFCSGKIIKPISESYEKQKRFITDAGHEIKTPLTIINANTDIIESEIGENEYIDDIRIQSKRLSELTNDLVYLAKMEEKDNKIDFIDIPLSDIVKETSEHFISVSQIDNLIFERKIEPMLSTKGNSKELIQLLNVLLENAFKYCSQNGKITLYLSKRNKNNELSITNTTNERIDKNDLNKIFDRFYRSDLSRNSETGGHGIGLSIAKAITLRHNGKITAECPTKDTFRIIVNLPT